MQPVALLNADRGLSVSTIIERCCDGNVQNNTRNRCNGNSIVLRMMTTVTALLLMSERSTVAPSSLIARLEISQPIGRRGGPERSTGEGAGVPSTWRLQSQPACSSMMHKAAVYNNNQSKPCMEWREESQCTGVLSSYHILPY